MPATPLLSSFMSLGLRRDGRRPNELRQVNCQLSFLNDTNANVNGSTKLTIGNTIVLVSVFGPKHSINYQSRMNKNGSTLMVSAQTTEFAISEHKATSKLFHANKLLANKIHDTFNKIIIHRLYPRSTIEIMIEILQNDGSLLAAVINCTTLALIDAGIALKDYCVACSAAYLDGNYLPILDLNFQEIFASKISKFNRFSTIKNAKLNYHEPNENLPYLKMKKNQRKALFVVGQTQNPNILNKNNTAENNEFDDSSNANSNSKMGMQVEEEMKSHQTIISVDNEEIEELEMEIMDETDDERLKKEKSQKQAQNTNYFHGHLTCAILPLTNKIVTIEMESIIDFDQMDILLAHCQTGCLRIHRIIKKAVKEHAYLQNERRAFINKY